MCLALVFPNLRICAFPNCTGTIIVDFSFDSDPYQDAISQLIRQRIATMNYNLTWIAVKYTIEFLMLRFLVWSSYTVSGSNLRIPLIKYWVDCHKCFSHVKRRVSILLDLILILCVGYSQSAWYIF